MSDKIEDDYVKLLEEYREQRESLKIMVTDLEVMRKNIDNIFPTEFKDARYKFIFEQKIKTATELLKTLLDIRREITKSIKDEIEIRKKITPAKDDDGEELDIRALAKKIESLNNQNLDKGVVNG